MTEAAAQKTADTQAPEVEEPYSPFDRLPLKEGTNKHPHPSNPYWTKRAAEARDSAFTYIPADTIKTAFQTLSDAGLSRSKRAYEDVADHNGLTLAAALTYAAHGLHVVDSHGITNKGEQTHPSNPNGCKVPRGGAWQGRATTDSDVIPSFWTGDGKYPAKDGNKSFAYARVNAARNVSIAYPKGCGLFALDIDGEAGQAELAKLESKHGPLPATPTIMSGSGKGFQMIFRTSETILNTASAIAPGIDIRGEGGQSVAPPSIHPTFGFYDWEERHAPGEVEIADAPEWLVNAALENSKKTQATHGRRIRPEGQARSVEYEPKEPTGDNRGFEAKLAAIGNPNFDIPILEAANQWFRAHGCDADSASLFDQLQDTILAVECDDNRNIRRYATPLYLEGRIEQARVYIQGEEAQESAFEQAGCGGVTEGQDNAGTEGQDVPPSGGEFEPVEDWLDDRYRCLSGKMLRKVPKAEMDAWAKACEEAKENDNDEPKQPEPVEICGAFDVVGRASNADGTEGAGRIISFEGENGKRVEVTLSLAEIRSDPKAVCDVLSDRGLWLPVGKNAKINLQMLLNSITPKRQIPTVNVPGWVRDEFGDIVGFMLPTGVYDRVSGVPFRLLEGSQIDVVKPKGTLEGQIAAYVAALSHADTNFYWALGVASAFAGPLLGILEWQPCGFSLSGLTSKGKTLAQLLASAAYGSPEPGRGVLFTANSTGNAIEDLAGCGTDTLLALDEIGALSDKSALVSILFALSTGRTKSRKRGRGRGLTEGDNFRPFVVLSSEKGMKNEIQAAGDSYRGGLAVRFPDIDVSDGVTVSADALASLEAVRSNYGHAGPVYIRYLQESGIAADAAKLEREVLDIAAKLAKGKGSAMARAARPFAVAQRGGEIAADAGLLGDIPTAKKTIQTAVQKAWDTFTQSDEAGAASAGEAAIDAFRSFVQKQWDRTIISAGDLTSTGEVAGDADGMQARGTPLGWYDADFIYLDWYQIEDPSKLGLDIGKRAELVKSLGKAVVRKSDREAPQAKLPAHVAQAADGKGRSVKNLKLKRDELGL